MPGEPLQSKVCSGRPRKGETLPLPPSTSIPAPRKIFHKAEGATECREREGLIVGRSSISSTHQGKRKRFPTTDSRVSAQILPKGHPHGEMYGTNRGRNHPLARSFLSTAAEERRGEKGCSVSDKDRRSGVTDSRKIVLPMLWR